MSTYCQRLLSISMTVILYVFTSHLPILSFQYVKKQYYLPKIHQTYFDRKSD